MLAIKTVLADTDDIPTLIFDEIDTGISGRTAQKVSERLSYIGKSIRYSVLPTFRRLRQWRIRTLK